MGAKGQGARAGDIYIHVFVSLTITYARSGHFQEKPKDKTRICFVLSLLCSICFFWGSEAHLVFRFRFEDSVLPAKESSLLRAEPVCCCCRDLLGVANRISWWITGLQMNFGLLSCLLSECDMKNIEKQ